MNEIYDSSISLSINTDGRAISNTSLSKEYAIVHSKLNWSMEKIIQSNLNAIEHSFTTNEKKEKLRKQLKSFS